MSGVFDKDCQLRVTLKYTDSTPVRSICNVLWAQGDIQDGQSSRRALSKTDYAPLLLMSPVLTDDSRVVLAAMIP